MFSGLVEHAIAHIEEAAVHEMEEPKQRWYAIKIFERDKKAIESVNLGEKKLSHIENDIRAVEIELDDDAESIIINERYEYITSLMEETYKKNRNLCGRIRRMLIASCKTLKEKSIMSV